MHRYILRQILRNLTLSICAFTFLFIIFDFFDRIDNVWAEEASIGLVFQYFLFKIPLMLTLMMPVSMLMTTLLTFGTLSRNSEITAMRAAGTTVHWLSRPLLAVGLLMSLVAIVLNETVVPYTSRRTREIYNIDIRQKDKRGGYSQSEFWWRTGNEFCSASQFDSRSNTLLDFSRFEVDQNFVALRRTDAEKVTWVDPILGWTMRAVTDYRFKPGGSVEVRKIPVQPLPIKEDPQHFYATQTDPRSMSFLQLKDFIGTQSANGISTSSYLADLYEKIAFPFVNVVIVLIALPFALKPARSGSMAASFMAGLIIGFSYYAVHSFSVAMGRAEIWPPLLAAWMANAVMGLVGAVLFAGAESPS